MVVKNLKDVKAHARRLADAMAKAGNPVALSKAYELTAQAAGHADWNTMAAGLKGPRELSLGEAVTGRYMGRAIAGKVHALRRKGADHLEIEIALERPVDVGTPTLPIERRRLRATLGPDGRSVGRRSDGVAHLELD